MSVTLKIKRGVDTNIVDAVLQQAEPAFTTDTRRLFLGVNGTSDKVEVQMKGSNYKYTTFKITDQSEQEKTVSAENNATTLEFIGSDGIVFDANDTNKTITIGISSVDYSDVSNVPDLSFKSSDDASAMTVAVGGDVTFNGTNGVAVSVNNTSDTITIDGTHNHSGTYVEPSTLGDYVKKDGTVSMTGALTLPGNPSATNQAATKGYVDTQLSSITAGFGAPLQNLSGLADLLSHLDDTPDCVDKQVRLVEDTGVQFRYDAQSTETADGSSVIVPDDIAVTAEYIADPTSVSGRWIKFSTGTSLHNGMSDLQGGTTDQYYHLTSTVYNELSTSGSTNAVTHRHANAGVETDGFMSSSDKTKLNGISSGAEVNQYALSNLNVDSTLVSANSKTDTFVINTSGNLESSVSGKTITLSINSTNLDADKLDGYHLTGMQVSLSGVVTGSGSFNGSTGIASITTSYGSYPAVGDLSNVTLTSVTNKDVLSWDTSGNIWKNVDVDTIIDSIDGGSF